MNNKFLVSACLLGINSKYNGEDNKVDLLLKNCDKLDFIPICPEQLGGLPTPRSACEISGCLTGEEVLDGKGSVIDKESNNFTKQFIKGAEETLRIARILNIKNVILKKRSPSCGYGIIYDGNFNGKLHSGNGVTAQILLNAGINIFTEDDITEEFFRGIKK